MGGSIAGSASAGGGANSVLGSALSRGSRAASGSPTGPGQDPASGSPDSRRIGLQLRGAGSTGGSTGAGSTGAGSTGAGSTGAAGSASAAFPFACRSPLPLPVPVLGRRHVQRPHDRECGKIDDLRIEAGLARGRQKVVDRLAARCDHQHSHARALSVVEALEHAVIEHGLLERHRQLLLRLEANGGVELLLALDVGQLDDAYDDLLAGDAETHDLRQAVVTEEGPQLLGETVHVGDLTFVEQPGRQRAGGSALQRRPTASREFCGSHEAGLDVEPYYRPCLLLEQSHSVVQTRRCQSHRGKLWFPSLARPHLYRPHAARSLGHSCPFGILLTGSYQAPWWAI